MYMNDVIWISWEKHRRTEEICDYFSIDLAVFTSSRKSIIRHLQLSYKTFKHIRARKPKVLIVQNPSIVLTAFTIIIRPFYKYRLIVDAHNEAVQPYAHDNFAVRTAANLLLRSADLTIVTNDILAITVNESKGKAAVLPDRLPTVAKITPAGLAEDTFNIAFIVTFASDEPVMQVIEAAGMLEGRITLYVTGNYRKLDESYRRNLPANIVFTGFLSEEDYWEYLFSADAIIDLSLKDNCMVCGAYEGVAVATPLILSRNQASMQYFHKGVVYTDNTTEHIHKAFLEMIDMHSVYAEEIKELGYELPEVWQQKAEHLGKIINSYLGADGALVT